MVQTVHEMQHMYGCVNTTTIPPFILTTRSGLSFLARPIPFRNCLWLKKGCCCLLPAAINSSDICAAAAGTWTPPACAVSQSPPCAAAGGSWFPRNMWSLEGGMDMLVVGLLQGALSYPFFDPVLTGVLARAGGGGGVFLGRC